MQAAPVAAGIPFSMQALFPVGACVSLPGNLWWRRVGAGSQIQDVIFATAYPSPYPLPQGEGNEEAR